VTVLLQGELRAQPDAQPPGRLLVEWTVLPPTLMPRVFVRVALLFLLRTTGSVFSVSKVRSWLPHSLQPIPGLLLPLPPGWR